MSFADFLAALLEADQDAVEFAVLGGGEGGAGEEEEDHNRTLGFGTDYRRPSGRAAREFS